VVESERDRCELDSHADKCVAGANTRVLSISGRIVQVLGFSTEGGAIDNIPIVTCATAYTRHNTGEMIVFELNEFLNFGDRGILHTLFCPN
jgi:hypothetical protein